MKPVEVEEHDTDLIYEATSYNLPILASTIYVPPDQPFRVKCKRDGDLSDVGIQDVAFEVFVDGVWVTGTCLKSKKSVLSHYQTHSRLRRYI
jgi:hypothetical protein